MRIANVVVVFFSLSVVVPIRADLQVNWLATLGFFAEDAADPNNPSVPGDYIRDGSQPGAGGVIARLLWSQDNSFGTITSGGTGTTEPDDIVLNTHLGAFSPFADYSAGTTVYTNVAFGETLQNGYLTAVINQDSAFDVGDYYNQGPIVSALPYNFTGGEPPVQYDHNTGDDAFFGGQLDSQVVPEPSAGGLFLVAIGGTLLRRKRRKGWRH